jgi:hypothetical protein
MANGVVEGGSTGAKASSRPRIRLSPVGFWSYTRRDDDFSRGRLSQLRSLVLAEIQTQYGRDDVQLFQDVGAIPDGADWEQLTTDAIRQASFFIPIVTPNYIQSPWCARETKMFATRVEAMFEAHPDLPRDRLRMFPLLWIPVEGIEPIDEAAAAALGAPQWSNFSKLRHRNLEQDEEVLAKIAAFAKSIVEVLQLRVEAPLSEEEKAQIVRGARDAERLAEEMRERREAEAREAERLQALAAERLADEERIRREEQAAEERRAARQRETEEAARGEEARRLEQERLQREEELKAERRARRDADLARLTAILRSRRLGIALGGIVALVVVVLVLTQGFGGGEAGRPTANSSASAAPAPAPQANLLAPSAVEPPPAPSIDWLLHRWCVGGNRANVQTIGGNRTRITIAFGGETQSEAVQEIREGVVRTEIARYRRDGEVLVIEEMGRQQRLERCG